jgi:hypothetical protein
MYACMWYVCMCISWYECMYVCMYIFVHMCMCVCITMICMHACIYVCMRAFANHASCGAHTLTLSRVQTNKLCMPRRTCVHVHCDDVYQHTHQQGKPIAAQLVLTHSRVHTHTHYMPTYVHIYTCTHKQGKNHTCVPIAVISFRGPNIIGKLNNPLIKAQNWTFSRSPGEGGFTVRKNVTTHA